MPRMLAAMAVMSACGLLVAACGTAQEPPDERALLLLSERHEREIGLQMAAQSTLTAHFIAAALRAEMSEDEINGTLAQIAGSTVIDEFWVSDETGEIEFSNVVGSDFRFPKDPTLKTDAAPFARLLTGEEKVVIQTTKPRRLDSKMFRYAGVSGIDSSRIVQVGQAER